MYYVNNNYKTVYNIKSLLLYIKILHFSETIVILLYFVSTNNFGEEPISGVNLRYLLHITHNKNTSTIWEFPSHYNYIELNICKIHINLLDVKVLFSEFLVVYSYLRRTIYFIHLYFINMLYKWITVESSKNFLIFLITFNLKLFNVIRILYIYINKQQYNKYLYYLKLKLHIC